MKKIFFLVVAKWENWKDCIFSEPKMSCHNIMQLKSLLVTLRIFLDLSNSNEIQMCEEIKVDIQS